MSSEPEKIYDSDPSEDTSWMLTYGDIITLLMIFFVLMFSSSKLSEEKFDKVAQSINESLNRPGLILKPILPRHRLFRLCRVRRLYSIK